MIFSQKNKIISTILLASICLLYSIFSKPFKIQAETSMSCTLTGVIVTDTVFSPSDCNPYIISSNLVLNTNTNLTIQPGTTLHFNDGTSLTIRGKLNAVGTASSPITFTSSNSLPAPGDWDGLKFDDDAIDATVSASYGYISGSILKHSVVEYATAGLYIDNSLPYIDSNTIRKNFQGINTKFYYDRDSAPLVIIHNSIVENGDATTPFGAGMYLDNNLGYIAHNNISYNFTSPTGISSDGGGVYIVSGEQIVTDNIISHNQAGSNNYSYARGGGIGVNSGKLTLINNVISHNKVLNNQGNGGGVYYGGGASQLIQGNLIIENEADYGGGMFFGDFKFEGDIINNTVINNVARSDGGGIVINDTSSSSPYYFKYNNLYGNVANGLPNDFTNNEMGYLPPEIDVRDNWWGTTDSTTIESHINHYVDDTDRGLVIYSPFLTEAGNDEGNINTSGGTFTSKDNQLKATFAPNAVGQPVTVYYTNVYTPTAAVPNNQTFVQGFTLRAIDSSDALISQFSADVTLVVSYPTDAVLAQSGIDEDDLNLVFWSGSEWVSLLPCNGCSINKSQNALTVVLDHFTEFAIFGENNDQQIFLPMIIR